MPLATPDERCLAIARSQCGAIARKQALNEGMTPRQIEVRLRRGTWVGRHRGVYVIGGAPPSWEQDLWAAYLALAPDAVVSHRSAAALWELDGIKRKHIELSMAHPPRVVPRDVIVHKAKTMDHWVLARKGLRLTTPTRTLIDLASVVPATVLEPALDAALRRRLTALPRLMDELHTMNGRGRKGTSLLKRLVQQRSPYERPSESWLESRLFAILRELGLPRPHRQVDVLNGKRHIARLDFAYPELKIGLEAVGYRFHGDQPGWHHDLKRRNDLLCLGWRVLYFAWLDIKMRPEEIKAQLEALRREIEPPLFR